MAINLNDEILKQAANMTYKELIEFFLSCYERGFNDAKAILEVGPNTDRLRSEITLAFIKRANNE
jgi:hypothetical protein